MSRFCFKNNRIDTRASHKKVGEFSLDFIPAISYTYMAFPSHLGAW